MQSTARRILRKLTNPAELAFEMRYRRAVARARASFERGDLEAPPFYQLLLTINNVCNFHCLSCDVGVDTEGQYYQNNHREGGGGQLSYAELTAMVDSVKAVRPEIFVVGVEPTLYPRMIDFLAYARGAGLRTQITTNGYLLARMAEDLVRIGHNLINVSIDCGVPEINDRVRGKEGALARALEGIRAITEAKRARGAYYPLVSVNSVISDHTYEHLEATVKALEGLDLDVITFSHLQFISPEMAAENNRLVPEYPALRSNITEVHPERIDMAKLRAAIEDLKWNYNYLNLSFRPDIPESELEKYYHTPKVLDRFRSCDLLWRNIQIMSNGDAIPVQRCFVKPLGNIREKPALEIWNDAPWRRLRQEITRHGGAFPACTRCSGLWC